MEGWEEACEAEDGVDDWDPVESLAVNDLHGAVVDAVEAEVEEEYGQEIVGGSGSSRETEIHAEDEVDDADDDEANQPRLKLCLGLIRPFLFDEEIPDLHGDDLGHDNQDLVVILHYSNVVSVDRDDDYNNDVTLGESYDYGVMDIDGLPSRKWPRRRVRCSRWRWSRGKVPLPVRRKLRQHSQKHRSDEP